MLVASRYFFMSVLAVKSEWWAGGAPRYDPARRHAVMKPQPGPGEPEASV